MDQATLVEMQIEDGQRLVDELRSRNFDVTAACWLKDSEEQHWFLYIASKVVDEKGVTAAYRDLHVAIGQILKLWVDPFEVKLISPTHPIAKDVLSIQQRYHAPIPTRYGGAELGGLSIDQAYIYPN